MKQIFIVVLVLSISACAAKPQSVYMSVSQDAESQALTESVAWVTLNYADTEGVRHSVLERSVQGFQGGLDADVELPEGVEPDEDGRWVATALDDQRRPIMSGEAEVGEEDVNVEIGVIK